MALTKNSSFEEILLAVKNLNDGSVAADIKSRLIDAINSYEPIDTTLLKENKTLIANALISKGTTASADESFSSLADKIKNIKAGTTIKSIQSGVIPDTSNSTTEKQLDFSFNLTQAVNVANSIIRITYLDGGGGNDDVNFRGEFVSSTCINVKRVGTGFRSNNIRWEVIEFENAKSIQKGTAFTSTRGTQTISINPVNINKTMVFYNYTYAYNNSS